MQLFNKILVYVDFTELSAKAIDTALETAIQCNSTELHLVTFVDVSSIGYLVLPEVGLAVNYPSLAEYEQVLQEKMLALQNTIQGKSSIRLVNAIIPGSFIQKISEYVLEHNVNLVVIPAIYTTGISEFLFGSNAQYAASKLPCPVLTVQANMKNEAIRKIILPVEDFYPENKMHYAMQLASIFHAQIYLIYLKQHTLDPGNSTAGILNKIGQELQSRLVPYCLIAAEGTNITDAILQYAETENRSLVLVNPGSESTLTGKIISSAGGNIVNHTAVPVLTIKKK